MLTPAQLLDQQQKASATMIEMEERRIEKMKRRQVPLASILFAPPPPDAICLFIYVTSSVASRTVRPRRKAPAHSHAPPRNLRKTKHHKKQKSKPRPVSE